MPGPRAPRGRPPRRPRARPFTRVKTKTCALRLALTPGLPALRCPLPWRFEAFLFTRALGPSVPGNTAGMNHRPRPGEILLRASARPSASARAPSEPPTLVAQLSPAPAAPLSRRGPAFPAQRVRHKQCSANARRGKPAGPDCHRRIRKKGRRSGRGAAAATRLYDLGGVKNFCRSLPPAKTESNTAGRRRCSRQRPPRHLPPPNRLPSRWELKTAAVCCIWWGLETELAARDRC